MDQSGRRLSGLHLFGLGAGLGVNPQLGSEPAFDERIYGVWLFHHDASRAVIEAVLARLRQKASADVRITPGIKNGAPGAPYGRSANDWQVCIE
ncbi:Uncharacterized protein ALO83_02612 [Pseudomonas cannabina pv. alisalensis]|uniref:Uncharacterized protein n=1 Tax=Pseudomonas cannabina TaxID=86840 RepID=A0A3M3RSM3_PSECA|nr:Uncharacterized protein AC507_2929 [Pseudomonas syringae pv. maculicola]KPW21430.1 Uncharacterized protein ALO83_02612 [Pseudomonas cannabina pv. alisalensis]RMN99408.1 hypothetical protein ALQ51_02658 [Pseudomonas cannabina]